jgi:hypothetical protein
VQEPQQKFVSYFSKDKKKKIIELNLSLEPKCDSLFSLLIDGTEFFGYVEVLSFRNNRYLSAEGFTESVWVCDTVNSCMIVLYTEEIHSSLY